MKIASHLVMVLFSVSVVVYFIEEFDNVNKAAYFWFMFLSFYGLYSSGRKLIKAINKV